MNEAPHARPDAAPSGVRSFLGAVGSGLSARLVFAGVLALLFAVHFRSLADPPYWDALIGAFPQAVWLAHNDFDLVRLATVERPCGAGGPNVYPFSLYPLLVGVLYASSLSPSAVFVVVHCAMLVCAAASAALFFELCRSRFAPPVPLLATLVLVSTPLFQSMSAQMNMDMPLLACTLLALVGVERGRMGQASLGALLALLVIPRGIIVVGAGLVALTALALRRSASGVDEGRSAPTARSIRRAWLAHLSLVAVFAAQVLIARSYARLPAHVAPGGGLAPLFSSHLWLVPDFGVAFVAALAGVVVILWRMSRGRAAWLDMCCAAFLIAFVAVYGQYRNTLPRYFLQAYPHVILVLMATVLSAERLRTVRTALLVAALALNVANQRGSFYERKRIPWPPSEFVDASLLANDGNVLERSMEYRDDLLLTRDVVAELDGLDRERTVLVTHWPLTQALAIPELGYVERPWRTSGRGSRLTYDPNAVPYGDVYSDDDPPTRKGAEDDVVWVMAPNAYVKPYLAPRPDRDEMLAEIRRGNRSTFVFRRGGWE